MKKLKSNKLWNLTASEGSSDHHPISKSRCMMFTEEDARYMQTAINIAREDPRDQVKVGAVIVKNGEILASAHGGEDLHRRQHAELTAINKCVGKDLMGSTLYTTLEPCVPDARMPNREPCAVAILNQPLRRVVIGVLDPNIEVRFKGLNMLESSTEIV